MTSPQHTTALQIEFPSDLNTLNPTLPKACLPINTHRYSISFFLAGMFKKLPWKAIYNPAREATSPVSDKSALKSFMVGRRFCSVHLPFPCGGVYI